MKAEWNYQPCTAERVLVVVADDSRFPTYWAREFIGQQRFAVEITQNGQTFYIDNEDDSGWFKVINGGGPEYAHKNINIEMIIARLEHAW